jgi:hypothetical protein
MSKQLPAPHLPPRKKPVYVADLIARMNKLRNTMSILKEDINNINRIILLWQREGHYCQSCTRRRRPGACGPTCVLLRPDAYKDPEIMVTLFCR